MAASVTKYLFDRSFDEEKSEAAEAEEPAAVEEELPPPEPTFSQAELDAARQQGHAAGRDEAMRESAEAVAQHIDQTINHLAQRLEDLFAARDEANDRAVHEAIAVAVGIARKILPEMNQRNALGEVERLVGSVIEHIVEEAKVRIEVHPEIAAEVETRVREMAAARGYEGRLTMIASDELALGDCRIDWGNGGAGRDIGELWREVDEILERNLGLTEADFTPAGAAPEDASEKEPGEALPDQTAGDEAAAEAEAEEQSDSIVEDDPPETEPPEPEPRTE